MVNDKLLKTTEMIKSSVEEKDHNTYTVKLALENVKLDQQGKYKVSVRNDKGTTNAVAQLGALKHYDEYWTELSTIQIPHHGSIKNYDESLRGPIIHHSSTGHFAIRDGKWKLNMLRGSGGSHKPVFVEIIIHHQ